MSNVQHHCTGFQQRFWFAWICHSSPKEPDFWASAEDLSLLQGILLSWAIFWYDPSQPIHCMFCGDEALSPRVLLSKTSLVFPSVFRRTSHLLSSSAQSDWANKDPADLNPQTAARADAVGCVILDLGVSDSHLHRTRWVTLSGLTSYNSSQAVGTRSGGFVKLVLNLLLMLWVQDWDHFVGIVTNQGHVFLHWQRNQNCGKLVLIQTLLNVPIMELHG